MKITWTTPDTVEITMTNEDLAIMQTALLELNNFTAHIPGPDSQELHLQSRTTLNAIKTAMTHARSL